MPCLSAACAFCPPPLKGLGWGRKRGGDPSSIAPQSGPREGIGKEGEGLLSPFILPRWGLRNENCPQPGQSEGMKGGPKTSSRASSRPDFGNRPSRGVSGHVAARMQEVGGSVAPCAVAPAGCTPALALSHLNVTPRPVSWIRISNPF